MGRRENIAMFEALREEYSSQFIELAQRKYVQFSSRREMVEFVAAYFTTEYCTSLALEKPVRKENAKKVEAWEQKVEAIGTVFEATKDAISLKCSKSEGKKNSFWSKIGLKNYDEVTFDLRQSMKAWQQALNMGREPILQTLIPTKEELVIQLSKNGVRKIMA